MYGVPDDYVITYDCSFLQEHIDSSDFEELCTPVVETKKGNHNLVKPRKQRMKRSYPEYQQNNATNLYIDCDEYPVKLKEENKTFSQKGIVTERKRHDRKHKYHNGEAINLNRGDRVETAKSKLSIIRHKVIPCISSIFRRTNPTKYNNMSVIEENQNENIRTDNCYQLCNNCEQRRMRKLYKRQQNYVVQPVYAIEGNAHKTSAGPFASTKITEKPLQHHNRKTKNQYSSYCSLSSSDSDSQCTRERQKKVDMFRKRLKTEIMKEHIKYQQNQQIRTQQVQYPSEENKYHVFTTPMQSRTNPHCYKDEVNKIPSSTSSFWEYLFDKTTACGKKYQNQRVELPPTQCACAMAHQHIQSGRSACCIRRNQQNVGMGSYGDLSGKDQKVQVTCTCKPQTTPSPCCTQKRSCDPSCMPPLQKRCDPLCSSDTLAKPSTMDMPAIPEKNKKKAQKTKVKCQCPEKSKLKDSQEKLKEKKSQQNLGRQGTNLKPCQEGHDEIVSSLAQKYNGEILCIHNPPCILINGCLNLPPQKDQQPNNDMSFWPVTENTKHSFYNQTNDVNRERSCQYHVEVNEGTDYRAEKIIQSICHHNPPCEVVRGCYKPKYDPQLENSCVHVPMCKQMPECMVIDRSRNGCEHRPRCRDIPICSRDFVILTARENIGTQVKTSMAGAETFVCRHEPPCIMIPKCIGRAMCDSSYVNVDAIPGCIHQPSCELIPACCRKSAKEMVSVSSQYPNSCRIV